MIECYKENWKNRCCCNCKHRIDIMKHPWNEGESKGSVKELFGCVAGDNVIFFDKEHDHGLCEIHEAKEINNLARNILLQISSCLLDGMCYTLIIKTSGVVAKMKLFLVCGLRSSGHHGQGQYKYLVQALTDAEASQVAFGQEKAFIRANPELKLSKKNKPHWVSEVDFSSNNGVISVESL